MGKIIFNMLIEDQSFKKINKIEQGTYENCQFISCDFEGADFSSYKFIDCSFDNCNLSLIKTENISFQDCLFKQCKMLGLQFALANTFNLSFKFEYCTLDHSSFQGLKIMKTVFANCSLKEVDFENTDCKQVVFENCNLERSIFFNSNLEQVDFSSANNVVLDPETNNIKGAKFSLDSLPGLLLKYKIKVII